MPIERAIRNRLFWFVAAALVIIASFVLQPNRDGRLSVAESRSLPTICWLRRTLGIECPGCGLTRSFVHMAHGNLAAAWHQNPFGVPLFLFAAAQLIWQPWQSWRIRSNRPVWQIPGGVWWLVALCVLMLIRWIWRISMGLH